MRLINLTKEERKKAYSLATMDLFRKCLKRADISPQQFLQKLKKSPERLTKAELDAYVEKNYLDGEDPIVEAFVQAAVKGLMNKFRSAPELVLLVHDKEYRKMDEETKEEVESFRQEYERANLKLSFDEFVRAACDIDTHSMLSNISEDAEEKLEILRGVIEDQEEDLEEADEENDRLRAQVKSLNRELKQKENEFSAKLEKVRGRYAVKNIRTAVSETAGFNITGKTYQDLYRCLDRLEKEALEAERFEDVQKILGAKFAMIKGRRGMA